MDCRREIAVENAAGEYRAHISGAIELELVYAIFLNHGEADFFEMLVIARTGQREPAIHNFIASFLARGDALLLSLSITAPWRKPDADAHAVLFRGRVDFRESIGKIGIESINRVGIVPAVIEEKRVHLYMALAYKLIAERMNPVQHLRLCVGFAQIVPGVVVQKG